jgi:hypothetical protein
VFNNRSLATAAAILPLPFLPFGAFSVKKKSPIIEDTPAIYAKIELKCQSNAHIVFGGK